jgi:hypothetical protein
MYTNKERVHTNKERVYTHKERGGMFFLRNLRSSILMPFFLNGTERGHDGMPPLLSLFLQVSNSHDEYLVGLFLQMSNCPNEYLVGLYL